MWRLPLRSYLCGACGSGAVRPAKKIVLVIDDGRRCLVTLSSGLSRAGYEMLEADNADDVDDAHLLAHHLRPDVVVMAPGSRPNFAPDSS